jgi:hypothetical protein
MQSAGMTFIIAMIVLCALFHLFWMAPSWAKLIVLSPLLWSLGRLCCGRSISGWAGRSNAVAWPRAPSVCD